MLTLLTHFLIGTKDALRYSTTIPGFRKKHLSCALVSSNFNLASLASEFRDAKLALNLAFCIYMAHHLSIQIHVYAIDLVVKNRRTSRELAIERILRALGRATYAYQQNC
jgi:hypothetical protein